jgi:hypothetical protein
MDPIQILNIAVRWSDGFENDPSLSFLLDRKPEWEVYEKRPSTDAQLSAEQTAAAGTSGARGRKGWHIYRACDGDFSTFFTWGGKPDQGFGGWRRDVPLTDGTVEHVTGGWSAGGTVAEQAGFPACFDGAYVTRLTQDRRTGLYRVGGGTVCHVNVDRVVTELARLRPELEAVDSPYGWTVKWKGRIDKRTFQRQEHDRRAVLRDSFKADLEPDYGWHWHQHITEEQSEALGCRPYSALGGTESEPDRHRRFALGHSTPRSSDLRSLTQHLGAGVECLTWS